MRIQINTSSAAPAYLDEQFPIEIEIGNEEDCEIEAELVAFLHPSDDGSRELSSHRERQAFSSLMP